MSASSSARDVYSPALMKARLPFASTKIVIGKYFDAEERDLLAAVGGDLLEDRELGAARPAPRRPLVDDDRVALQVGKALVESAAVEDRARLVVERGERGRRAGELLLGLLE